MKNMKKHVALIVGIISLIAVFALATAENTNITSNLSKGDVKAGETVTVTVSMNTTTVTSLGATVTVGDNLEVQAGEWLKSGTIANFDKTKNKGAFAPGSATEISGDIFKVTVKAKTAGATTNDIKIELVAKNGTTTLWTESITHKVKISCASHTFGNYTKSDTTHTRTCAACGFVESESHKMDSGKITSPATCTTEGILTKTCSVCQHSVTSTIPKSAHAYSEWVTINDTQHEHKCICGASEKANHNWGAWEVSVPATCDEEGIKVSACKDCKTERTDTIALTEHTYSNACDTTCNTCGAKRTTSHSLSSKWESDNDTHWHTCTVCKIKDNVSAHIASEWIIDKQATNNSAGAKHIECVVCKVTLQTESIPAISCKHTEGTKISGVKEANCTQNGYTGDTVCKTCNTVLTKGQTVDALGHNFQITGAKEATCTEHGATGEKICTVCNETISNEVIPKLEHNFINGTCTMCGITGSSVTTDDVTTPDISTTAPDTNHTTDTLPPVTGEGTSSSTTTSADTTGTSTPGNSGGTWIVIICVIVAVIISGLVTFIILKRKKH